MSDQKNERSPKTATAFSGRSPRPPKRTAHALEESPGGPGTPVYLLDPMIVRDLAGALGLKPFQVVSDLMKLKVFKSPDDSVDFAVAATVARMHGFRAERPPPGMLIL